MDLNDEVNDIAEILMAQAGDRDVALSVETLGENLPVLAEQVMVREAIVHLVDNALRNGGPELSRIALTLHRVNGSARIEVRGDGRGIAPDQLDTAMARFGQATPGEGSGLGLPIVQAVAERHGGTLEVDMDGPGLSVTIDLPLAPQRPMA